MEEISVMAKQFTPHWASAACAAARRAMEEKGALHGSEVAMRA